jgi:hypothetical protein
MLTINNVKITILFIDSKEPNYVAIMPELQIKETKREIISLKAKILMLDNQT